MCGGATRSVYNVLLKQDTQILTLKTRYTQIRRRGEQILHPMNMIRTTNPPRLTNTHTDTYFTAENAYSSARIFREDHKCVCVSFELSLMFYCNAKPTETFVGVKYVREPHIEEHQYIMDPI